MSSFEFRAHSPSATGFGRGGVVNDCGSAASRACRPHKGNASSHEDRIAQSGIFSRVRRLNANGDVEVRLGCRSTVFVLRLYAMEAARSPAPCRFEVGGLARILANSRSVNPASLAHLFTFLRRAQIIDLILLRSGLCTKSIDCLATTLLRAALL